jgi:membrane-associated phospholipid phosphatase
VTDTPASAALERQPVDGLMAVYAIVSGVVLLLPNRPVIWPVLAVFHFALAWMALGWPLGESLRARIVSAWPGSALLLREWYPLLLLPVFYAELELLNISVHGGRMFDSWVQVWEEALFGGQPSRAWARAMPNLLLSEALHAAYLSYYLLLYVPALAIWLRRPRADFRLAVFTVMLAFVAHYLFFIYFPVEGPRYQFDAPTGGIENGIFYSLAHRLLEAGSSQGAAFPSSHVGASAAVSIAAMRCWPRFGALLALLTCGVALGAVYGGFHYAVDVIAGLILGTAMALLAPQVYRRLQRGTGATVSSSL